MSDRPSRRRVLKSLVTGAAATVAVSARRAASAAELKLGPTYAGPHAASHPSQPAHPTHLPSP